MRRYTEIISGKITSDRLFDINIDFAFFIYKVLVNKFANDFYG